MAQTEHRVGPGAWGHGASEVAPSSVIRSVGDEATTGVSARSVVSEAVTVRRCVDIGGSAPMSTQSGAPRVAAAVSSPAPALVVQRAPVAEPVLAAPRGPAPEPVLGRLIPMPCLVAGGTPSGARREGVAPRSEPIAPPAPPSSATFPVLEIAPQAPPESQPPSTVDPMAQTEPEIPLVSAELLVITPARRARPEPELPGVVVRPSLVLTPDQLAHEDTSALLMLAPPDIAQFCAPPRSSDPSAPTLPPLSTRTVPLSVFSARTMPVPVLEPTAGPSKTHGRVLAALGFCVVLIVAFAAGLLVTTAIVVGIDPTSCR